MLANFSLLATAGTCTVLTGQNGSGKTSLLRYLAGLLPPRRDLVPKFHFCGTQRAVKTHLTVVENLRFWQILWNAPAAMIDEALADWSLHTLQDVPARLLSSGQRQKLALARLSLERRPLWLLDEPENALDESARTRLAALIERHTRANGIAIVATHQPAFLQHVSNLQSVVMNPQ